MANKKISQLTAAGPLVGTETLPIVQGGITVKTTAQLIADLALKGTNYVFVSANGTEAENGNELVAAYNTAKTMNPSADNRITVIAAPGYYFLPAELELDTEYIDLVSLDGNRSVIISGALNSSGLYYFSDQADTNQVGYEIDEGGNDMYDGGNEIYADGYHVAYTHTQLTGYQSGGVPTTITAINTFTYVASGTGLTDNTYTYLSGATSGSGSGGTFDIEVVGGVVVSVEITTGCCSLYRGINYAINDTITILGSQIGGVDGVDDVVITVTSLIGYFDINTSVISSGETYVDGFTYVATGTTASDSIYENVYGSLTSGSGQHATFNIEVVGGEVVNVSSNKLGVNYNVNDTITILGSQIGGTDGVDDVIITVTFVYGYFGSSASYFTNMYPGFFFMGAQDTAIDTFLIDGGLGADGSGFLNYYTFSQGGYQVYVKRVGGTNDPSVNHIIITNPSDASAIAQTVSSSTNDDTHELSNLLAAGVTEIYHMVFAKSSGGVLSSSEVSGVVSEFLSILGLSTNINQLLTNLNSNYTNLTQEIVFNPAGNTISVIANDVFIKDVDVLTKTFKIGSDLFLLKVENCKGGQYSFGGDSTGSNPIEVSGTFIDCVGGNQSFGYNGTASGTFINCTALNGAFGDEGIASGTFTDCTALNSSFGSSGTASGTFTNCKSGSYCFGAGGVASGIFNNCQSDGNAFGGGSSGALATGTFTNCQSGFASFGGSASGSTPPNSGVFTNCIGGDQCFGVPGGVYINCVAGDYSFGYTGQAASGTFINCVAGNSSFGHQVAAASGTFTNCTAGDYSFGSNQINTSVSASGTFTNCIAGEYSFGNIPTGTLDGKLYYCRLTSGTFNTVSGGGRTYYCVDGNGNVNNQ